MTISMKSYTYSRSFRFGFLDGSLDRKPKKNNEIKKITVVYTNIFNVSIVIFLILQNNH